ncbi:MAG: hypothetical protein HY246_04625 [Proteobacteria bacterium]|nr:hypothetical protein [Pseudomonadota bacterium]
MVRDGRCRGLLTMRPYFCFSLPEEHASFDGEPHLEELRCSRRSVSKERFAAQIVDANGVVSGVRLEGRGKHLTQMRLPRL